MVNKDFDGWDEFKKLIQAKETPFYCRRREVWWCSLGINIGSEQDGQGNLFERPVLILQVFNRDIVRVVPITENRSENKYHFPIQYNGKIFSVITSHIQTVSTKRLSRIAARIEEDQFAYIKDQCRKTL